MVDRKADRLALSVGDEIEVTPEMIEAGVAKLYEFPITEPYEEKMKEAVAQVYRVMEYTHRLGLES